MSNDRKDLLDLHPAAVLGDLFAGRQHRHAAAEDAEPERYEPRLGPRRAPPGRGP